MQPRVQAVAAGLLSLGLAALAFACAAGDKSPFAGAAFLAIGADDGGSDGGGAADDSPPMVPPMVPYDAPTGDEPPTGQDVATGGDDSGTGAGASDSGTCNPPTCAACVTGNQCCTAMGTCGCTWILGCIAL